MPAATDTADEILRCARTLIVVGGYNGFSYADIAAVVGIRKASIHHHFPTKVDLVRTLLQRYRAEVEAGIAEFERRYPNPVDQLRAYVGYWESCVGDPTNSFCVCALLAAQIPVLPQELVLELRAHFRALSAWLTSALDRGAKQGTVALTSTPHAEAETFMATMHGAMLSARAYGDPAIFHQITTPLIQRLAA
ncbi:TetR/AcrR family transcriptional regulator [Mycolicibacterium goodii]|uniref:TetR/AcrR family transcriptional regulator n=1 Tax=Mycolicibacterium goodii TaxID=134601 RepID=A0ABS6HU24_MYCGD|nr:TetR/AcrR family transcriptional regulator [Mycolicibacterium goodii]MBU8824858.1 TetR/AcrR family transcriptional regulator [Mycolicibacterium goodii]MBU8839857.1 TetR/AcrR family transcriptional regulator [Mycolicibacterium goodii]